MTAYITGTELVRLGVKMGGDEGKDIQRNAVDVNEGVPPLADVCQRSRNIPIELRNIVEGEAVEEVDVSLLKISQVGLPRCFVTYDGEQAARFSSSFRAKTS